jgi:hypothetical protein
MTVGIGEVPMRRQSSAFQRQRVATRGFPSAGGRERLVMRLRVRATAVERDTVRLLGFSMRCGGETARRARRARRAIQGSSVSGRRAVQPSSGATSHPRKDSCSPAKVIALLVKVSSFVAEAPSFL